MKNCSIPSLLAAALCFTSLFARGADVYVGVGFYQLSPDPVYIKSGDIVYWVEADPDFAPYIIDIFGQQLLVPYGVQILAPGSYPYTAYSIYGGQWNGTVNVRTNAYPSVAITSPTNNAAFTAPASFTVTADASDPDPNDVARVEFWLENDLAGTDYTTPYSLTLTAVPAGTYAVKAIVRDYGNATATNTIIVTVGSVGGIILGPANVSSSNLVFNVTGLTVGKTNVLQSSTNLFDWSPVCTNVAATTAASFTNAMAGARRFFRVAQLP